MEIKDFTIRIENLPEFEYYDGDESILKIKLWLKIQNIMKSKLNIEMRKYNVEYNIENPKY